MYYSFIITYIDVTMLLSFHLTLLYHIIFSFSFWIQIILNAPTNTLGKSIISEYGFGEGAGVCYVHVDKTATKI